MKTAKQKKIRWITRYLAAALMISVTGGCAYFNSYYNAKKLYDSGSRSRRGFPDTLLAAGAETAALQQAAEKFVKVAGTYPNSRWVSPSLYYMGNCYFFLGQNEKALRKYQEVWQFYGSGKYAPLARLNSAVLSYKTGDYPAALLELQVLNSCPDQRISQQAAFLEAEVSQASGDYAQAAILWQRFLFNHPKSEFAVEARFKYAQILIAQDQPRQAALELEILAGRRLPPKKGYQIRLLLAQCYQTLGESQKALELYRTLLKKALPNSAQADLLELFISQILAGSAALPEAMQIYDRLARKYPENLAASVSYYRMGELQEAAQNLDSAKALYARSSQGKNTNIDHPAFSGIRTLALKKMENISLLSGYRQQLDSAAAEQNAQLLFLMAEHYLFGLGQPDSAVSVYLKLASDYPSAPIAAKSLYAAAWTLDKYQKDTALVRTYRLQLVERYPLTRYANAARMELGLPPDLTVSDSEPLIEFKIKLPEAPVLPLPSEQPPEQKSDPLSETPPEPAIPGPTDNDNLKNITK
jgi:TolA-binding protein